MLIEVIPCLKDNYAYLIHDPQTRVTGVVDPSEAEPILAALKTHQWNLDYICNTHHHFDHVGGNLELKAKTGATVIGFKEDQQRIPGIDRGVCENECLEIGKLKTKVLFIPGHTLGHIAYYFPQEKAVFVGDTLFSLGCGRLFEGTVEQMWQSLKKLRDLPDDTLIYCGHEYTLSNALFALSLEPDNPLIVEYIEKCKIRRAQHHPTIPTTIEFERKMNPFLRVGDVDAFAALRTLKDNFKGV